MDRIPYGANMPEPLPADLEDVEPGVMYTFSVPPPPTPQWVKDIVARRFGDQAAGEAGLEWGASRLVIDRRPMLRDPIGELGLSENIMVIPPQSE